MFESIMNKIKKITKKEDQTLKSKDAAKERLHLVLMQDRANVSADFLDLMKQEIIEVIKKYIDIDEKAMDVRLTNKENSDGTNGAPALYANIPILNIKEEARQTSKVESNKTNKAEDYPKYIYKNNTSDIDNNFKSNNIENNYDSSNNSDLENNYNYTNTNNKVGSNNYENHNIKEENNYVYENISSEKTEKINKENEVTANEEIEKEEVKIENDSVKNQNNNFQKQNNKNFQKRNKNLKKHKHKKY